MSDDSVRTVTLEQPLVRGEQSIGFLAIRKPDAGGLRGLSLVQLAQLDYATLETLLPRITDPVLTKADVARLAAVDLMAIGGEIMDFLLPSSARTAAQLQ